MNGTATRFLRLGVSLAGLVTLGCVLTGQAAKPVRHAIPTDWSHRHLIFSRPRSAEQAARLSEDPRYLQQVYRRQQRLALPVVAEADAQAAAKGSKLKIMSQKLHRDWSKNFGSGGSVGAGNYPAKFSFDTTTSFCDAATTPDYAVFGTGLAGSIGQASILAYDNLYFGCGGVATPSVYWAYNTAGQVKTSPVLSLDGTQVAFVQTNAGAGAIVLLKWARGGTVILPTTLVPVAPALYHACPAPCMTEIPLLVGGVGLPTDDTTSSVYYDYTNDVGWVGDGSGWLHKITGMFKGTPTEVTTGGFPVHVNTGSPLSSAIYDRVSNGVFVGDLGGFLYRVNATTGGVTASARLDHGVGIAEGPVVDSSNGFVYVFASDDGIVNCLAGLTPVDCSGVYQLTTNFASGSAGSEATVGASNLGSTPNPLYIGSFDSAYYDSTGVNAATGKLYVCGDTGGNPTLYQVPLLAGAFPLSGQGLAVAQLAIAAVACSPVTDVPNENLPGGFSERLFVSVQNSASSSTCSSGGCVLNFISAPWIPFTNYVVGQQILSSKGHVETVIQTGTSATINQPIWSTQPAATRTDGNVATQVTWIDQGAFDAPFVTWIASHTYGSLFDKILDPAGNVQVLTTLGTSDVAPPAWNPTPGLTTPDNTVTWTNVGKLGTAALPAAGGTSGIIVDNTLQVIDGSPGSQIYFSTLSDGACGGGCAVQASQPGLN